jgi:HAD superfamily hydrolase (TIGR01509 family)
MLRAVLFDMDGVLVDSFEAWLRLMNATASHFGCSPVGRGRFRAVYGQPTEKDAEAFFPGHTVKEIETFYDAHFTEYTEFVHADPAASEVVASLRQRGVRTAVVTNTLSALARRILGEAGIEPDAVVGANDVPHAKPAPDMVHRACDLLGVLPSEALMVGDSQYDREAATKAGARFAGLGIDGDDRLQQLADVLALVGH